jgi:hypothetical protein
VDTDEIALLEDNQTKFAVVSRLAKRNTGPKRFNLGLENCTDDINDGQECMFMVV